MIFSLLLLSIIAFLPSVVPRPSPFPPNLPQCDNSVWSPVIKNYTPSQNQFVFVDTKLAPSGVIPNLGPDKNTTDGMLVQMYSAHDSIMTRYWTGDQKFFDMLWDGDDGFTKKDNSFITRLTTSSFDHVYLIYSEFNSTTGDTTVYAVPQLMSWQYWWKQYVVQVYTTKDLIIHFDAAVRDDVVYITVHQTDKQIFVITSTDMQTFKPQGVLHWSVSQSDPSFRPEQYDIFSSENSIAKEMWIVWSVEREWAYPFSYRDHQSVICQFWTWTGSILVENCIVLTDVLVDLYNQTTTRGAANHDGTRAIITRSGYCHVKSQFYIERRQE